MEVIYSAKSCEEEDSEEQDKQYPYNNNNNILEQISSDSKFSSDINSFNNENFPDSINNLSDNENDFGEINNKENIVEKIPSNEAVPFIIYQNNKFIITNKSKILLNQNQFKNIGIISLVGKYRTGKSFLLNRVILNNKSKIGFSVGPTFKPCTKGIWIWSEPIMIKNSHSVNNEEFPCFLIDTEGLGAYDEEVNHDSKIFLISILISSLFIFNSFGTIDENAISSLSFVVNLSKTIKLKNSFKEDNKDELVEYFPCFLWLLRDFSLKLVDQNGKNITEKQYLEHALENIKGEENNEVIKEKNRVRSLIRTYFPERDCFTLVRPVEDEKNLQNLQALSDDELRSEFLEQAKNFRNKVYKKIRPKVFHGHLISGSMLIELVQSILDSINGGGIPVIENSWKYVMKNECVKKGKELLEMFAKVLREYRDKNKNKKDFYINIKNDTLLISQKYINEFNNSNSLDIETRKEFCEKLKNKINEELIKFNKENEKLFEDKFIKDLNILSYQFMQNFSNNDIYENNSYQFFQDFEVFREKAIASTPEFPRKNEILFDKILLIIKKFINCKMMKIKVINEEKNFLKEEFETNNVKINELNKEIDSIKEKNEEQLNKLNDELTIEKTKNQSIEYKLNSILTKKNEDFTNLKNQFNTQKNNYEKKVKEITDIKNIMKKKLKVKEEQLLVMKMNNEKITSLYEQKSQFLENEASSWKNKYHDALIETKNKENELNKENIKLKEQNKLLEKKFEENKNKKNISKNKNRNNKSFSNQNDIMINYANIQLSQNKENEKDELNVNKENTNYKSNIIKIENILSEKDIEKRNKNKNNIKTKLIFNNSNNNKNKGETLINLNNYKDKINSSKDFKCKYCLKYFTFQEYKEHYNICNKNPMNDNSNSTIKNNNKITINTSNNNINKRNNNNYSDIIGNINISNSKVSVNKKKLSNDNIMNNSNSINNDSSNKKYISINYDNINNIRIDTNSNNLNKNNFNNINIKINNQNININRNLININSIKKITNNINLNNYINNTKNNYITKVDNNKKNNISISNNSTSKVTHLNHSNYSSNISNNTTKNYSISPIPNFNPKQLKIKIVKGRIRKDKTGKPYLEYIIELNHLNKKWVINKRFSQFTNFYKNLKKMEIQEGITIPRSANIFSNIGTVFSGLSHEDKILNLERFLKDISFNENISNTSLYRNFFETERISNEIRISRKNSYSNNLYNDTKNKTLQNLFNDNNRNNKIYSKKLSNTSCLSHQNNQTNNSSYSNNIENKLEKMVQEIKASKASKKIPRSNNNYNYNINYFQPKTLNNKTFKTIKFSNKTIND